MKNCWGIWQWVKDQSLWTRPNGLPIWVYTNKEIQDTIDLENKKLWYSKPLDRFKTEKIKMLVNLSTVNKDRRGDENIYKWEETTLEINFDWMLIVGHRGIEIRYNGPIHNPDFREWVHFQFI